MTNYSAPTCHTTLQRIKQKTENELISNPSLQTAFSNPVNARPSFTLGADPLVVQTTDFGSERGHGDYPHRDEQVHKLARTWSVGKLVNSIEGSPPHSLQEVTPTSYGLSSPGSRPGSKLSLAAIQLSNGAIKPFPAPKPPSLVPGPKPVLRHTVRVVLSVEN